MLIVFKGRTTITIAHRLSTVKDVDVIYVVGDGQLIEQGSHNELLVANGAYARLVQAQKLRESHETSNDHDTVDEKGSKDMGELAYETPGRINTEHSMSSEIIKQKRVDAGKEEEADYGLAYLFFRMGKLVPETWRSYFLGCLSAIRKLQICPLDDTC